MLNFAWLTSAPDCDCFVIALPAFPADGVLC